MKQIKHLTAVERQLLVIRYLCYVHVTLYSYFFIPVIEKGQICSIILFLMFIMLLVGFFRFRWVIEIAFVDTDSGKSNAPVIFNYFFFFSNNKFLK